MAERELLFHDKVRHLITQHVSPEAHFALTENFPQVLEVGLAYSQCNGTGMSRRTVFPELTYAPFSQNAISKLHLARESLQPRTTLVLSTGEANLGAHNFSNEVSQSSVTAAEA